MTVEELIQICNLLKLSPIQVIGLYCSEKGIEGPDQTNASYIELVEKGYSARGNPTQKYINAKNKILGKTQIINHIIPVVCPALQPVVTTSFLYKQCGIILKFIFKIKK